MCFLDLGVKGLRSFSSSSSSSLSASSWSFLLVCTCILHLPFLAVPSIPFVQLSVPGELALQLVRFCLRWKAKWTNFTSCLRSTLTGFSSPCFFSRKRSKTLNCFRLQPPRSELTLVEMEEKILNKNVVPFPERLNSLILDSEDSLPLCFWIWDGFYTKTPALQNQTNAPSFSSFELAQFVGSEIEMKNSLILWIRLIGLSATRLWTIRLHCTGLPLNIASIEYEYSWLPAGR